MNSFTRFSVLGALAIAAAVSGSGAALAAQQPSPSHSVKVAPAKTAVADEQKALDDIVRARIDLRHGWNRAARDRMEKAETVLLNSDQAHRYSAPVVVTKLNEAREELAKHDTKAVSASLKSAQEALHTPAA